MDEQLGFRRTRQNNKDLPFLGGVFVEVLKSFATVLTLLAFSLGFFSSRLPEAGGCVGAVWWVLA